MEVFVPFEISKKLKEKGFKQGYNTFGYKLIFSDENTIKYIWDIGAYENEYFGINVPCPAISQVLKWLREEKNIICLPHIDPFEEKWFFYVVILPQASDFPEYMSSIIYNNYEEAALAGIEYVLDNLL